MKKNDKDMNKGNEVYKDPVDDNSYRQDSSLSMNLSVRSNLHKFLILGVIGFLLITAISEIPLNGIRIYDLLGKPSITKNTSRFILKFLSYRIESSTLSTPLYIGLFICLLMSIYYVIEAKMTQYNINFRFLEIKKGVFNRTFDTIDLVHIKDQILERPLWFRILGLSRLIILSNDKTTPELKISAVDSKKAVLFLDFIRQNAYGNATEYWIAKDRRRRNEKDQSPDNRVYNIDNDSGDRTDT